MFCITNSLVNCSKNKNYRVASYFICSLVDATAGAILFSIGVAVLSGALHIPLSSSGTILTTIGAFELGGLLLGCFILNHVCHPFPKKREEVQNFD